MGGSHAATGALAGVAATGLLAPLFGVPAGPVELTAAAGIGAGAALLPDLDHPNSTATRSQGPATGLVSRGARALSAAVYRRTRTRGDRVSDGEHRYLLHTPLFALAVGAAVGVVCSLWWQALAVVLWLTLSLALRGLGQCLPRGRNRRELGSWPTVSLLAGVATALLVGWGGVATGGYVGAVLAMGMIVHSLGDALTRTAVPLAWPVRIRGQRWRMVGMPHGLRFSTGSPVELVIRWGCLLGTPALGAALLV
nr:metal-dependent hydrolase [Nocardiopsis mwathae]